MNSLSLGSFPSFCGILVGSYTIIQWSLLRLFQRFFRTSSAQHGPRGTISRVSRLGCSRCLAGFLASFLCIELLNRESTTCPSTQNGIVVREVAPTTTKFAGKTMGLTTATAIRALDTAIGYVGIGARTKSGRESMRSIQTYRSSRSADRLVFAISAGAIMWSWFYAPQQLPREYRKWIKEAAQIDHRLVEALQLCRNGRFVYGSPLNRDVLQSMCIEEKWPIEWADPAVTVPVPCEMVHMGLGGSSCTRHAALRFSKAFKFAIAMYVPIQLVMKLRNPSQKSLRAVLVDASRSSLFLATFISLFYSSVCLSRTIIGPRLLQRNAESHQRLDSGLCVGFGCVSCGWSIFFEEFGKIGELSLFVAPKAVGLALPKSYKREVRSREFRVGIRC